MKISLIVAAGIAIVAAKKRELTKAEFQDVKERGVTDFEESMFEKCGGKPAIPENATDIECWASYHDFDNMKNSFIGCEPICPDGWRPAKKSWTYCRLNHPKESRRAKFIKELGPCRPMCPDMGEVLKNLPSNVHVEHDVKDSWKWDGIPRMKFSCSDKGDQLTIKGRFQN